MEDGKWTWDGIDYAHRILLWDPNHVDGGDEVQLYYHDRSLAWCIPAYGLTNLVSGAGELLYVVEDIPAIFSYFAERVQPLPGDVNGDAALSIADAVLMSRYLAEDAAVPKASGRYNADPSADGTADLEDLLYILRTLSA